MTTRRAAAVPALPGLSAPRIDQHFAACPCAGYGECFGQLGEPETVGDNGLELDLAQPAGCRPETTATCSTIAADQAQFPEVEVM